MRNKTARQHNFAIVPRADIPRSAYTMRQTRKQAFDASDLIPIMVEEVLPGDTWNHTETIMARLATPIAPIMDDMDLETFYFFVPNRILDDQWANFITGTDTDIGPMKITPTNEDNSANTIVATGVLDHMGLPPITFTTARRITAYPIIGYFKIWNEWFRDQNLQAEWEWPEDWRAGTYTTAHISQDGVSWNQMPLRINKRHDQITSCLPWPQKGDPVTIPLGTTAPVYTGANHTLTPGSAPLHWGNATSGAVITGTQQLGVSTGNTVTHDGALGTNQFPAAPINLYTDLNAASAATINTLRLAFQTQKLLERDARGGSRLVESILAHFGVQLPDYTAQRPEYLGGSKIPVTVNPIAQTAQYAADPGTGTVDSALGNLGAEMHASGHKRTFNYAAVEHGYIIGLAAVRATPTYQQGIRRHWERETRLDHYFPVYAMLGEQAVKTSELFVQPNGTYTNATWGYNEAWYEYRYTPNEITGVLRSTHPQPLDWWHLSEEFETEPALNGDFITDKTKEVLARALATMPSQQWSAQIIMDILHVSQVGRLMPLYSEPGLIDHF